MVYVHGYALKRECDLMIVNVDKAGKTTFEETPIDWRKVAAKLSSDAEISRTEMLSGKHPPEVIMVAGCVAEILASLSRAIEDGLS